MAAFTGCRIGRSLSAPFSQTLDLLQPTGRGVAAAARHWATSGTNGGAYRRNSSCSMRCQLEKMMMPPYHDTVHIAQENRRAGHVFRPLRHRMVRGRNIVDRPFDRGIEQFDDDAVDLGDLTRRGAAAVPCVQGYGACRWLRLPFPGDWITTSADPVCPRAGLLQCGVRTIR